MPNVPKIAILSAIFSISAPFQAAAQRAPVTADSAVPAPHYADFADLVLKSPLIVDATVHSTVLIKGAEAAGVAPGLVRLYINANVNALVRGPGGIPAQIGYVVDVPLDQRGRVPKLKKVRVLLFARPVAGSPAQIQLSARDSQRRWTPAADALTRRIVQESVSPDAPPVVTGIGNAFHVPGSLPGEGETQIFLTTADNRPVSLNVLRRPGEQPRWAVALSEIVDASAAPPTRDTLLWYRLACALPAQLSESSLDSSDPRNAALAREDYHFVLQSLGPCDRRPAY